MRVWIRVSIAERVTDEVSEEILLDVIARFPRVRTVVALNKTVALCVLEVLVKDPDPRVRFMVAMKRKLAPNISEPAGHCFTS